MKATGPLSRIRVVLARPSHPGNIGAAARAMKTMGIARLSLVRPKRFPDPDARALAKGARDVLQSARVCADLDEALAGTTFSVAMSARERELSHPPLAVRAAKESVNRAYELSLEAGLEFERRNFFMLFASDDQKEGMAAFVEKRKPTWKGR